MEPHFASLQNHISSTSLFACPQEVKGKTAQMDADLAARQAALEAQEQARDIARDKLEAIDGRVAALGEGRVRSLHAEERHCLPRPGH
jgi:hypothetical protein